MAARGSNEVQGQGSGVMGGEWGGRGWGSTSKNCPSHHTYKSPKQFVNRILGD